MPNPDDTERLLDRLDALLRTPAELPKSAPRDADAIDRAQHRSPALGRLRPDGLTGHEPSLSAERTIPPALELLCTPDTRDLAVHTLVRLGDASIPALLDLFHDEDRHIRQAAAWAIARIRDRRVTVKIIRVAHWTYDAASHSDDPHALPALLEALTVGSRPTRFGVALALGRLADKGLKSTRALSELIELLNDPYPLARIGGAWALGRSGSEAAVPHLAVALYDIDALVGRIAAGALAQIGTEEALTLLTAWRAAR